MKIGFIGDLHLGNNEESETYVKYQKESLLWIFDTLDDLGIKDICFLGDIVDSRKEVTYKTIDLLNFVLENSKDFNREWVLGNHDSFYKNTNELNIMTLLNEKFGRAATTMVFETDYLCLCPWITSSNQEQIQKDLKLSKKKYLAGHLELKGFELQKGIVQKKGSIERKYIDHFDLVISGHYHNHSKNGNVIYLGTPYEMNFGESGVSKYIGILDTDAGDLEYIQNPNTYFEKIIVNSVDDAKLLDLETLREKRVQITLNCETEKTINHKILELAENIPKLKIINNYEIMKEIDITVDTSNMTTIELWEEFSKKIPKEDVNPNQKKRIDKLFKEMYNEVVIGE